MNVTYYSHPQVQSNPLRFFVSRTINFVTICRHVGWQEQHNILCCEKNIDMYSGLHCHCSKERQQCCWHVVCILHPPYQGYNPLSLSITSHFISLLSDTEQNKISM